MTEPLRKRLGEILVEMGAVTPEQVEAALAHQRGGAMRVGEALVSLGHTDEAAVARGLARQAGLRFVDLSKGKPSADILGRVPAAVALEYGLLPLVERHGKLVVAIDDPPKAHLADNLRFLLDTEIECAIAGPQALRRALAACYGGDGVATSSAGVAGEAGEEEGDDAPVVRLVRRTVEEALRGRASDIHVEPFSNRVRIRFRIDGVLKEVAEHPVHLHAPLLSRLKLMAAMDIAEKRKPQDGRIAIRVGGRDIDVRASVLPASHGETFVMRLLDRERNLLTLKDLGLHPDDEKRHRRLLSLPNGLVLVTGPTGSGKTTTLYASLAALNRPDLKILTAEDPIEYHLRGVNQIQVRPRIGLTFARILRAMLRQAPNVILVGEIRDRETAEVAIQAALTGHLVFSTLHTNDAPSAITRLVDMGAPAFLVAAGLQAAIAQRLVRVLCERCRQPYEAPASLDAALGLPAESLGGRTLYRARGCGTCSGSGYHGRRALYEILEIDSDVRGAVYRGEPATHLRDRARAAGRYSTLFEDGIRKVHTGLTTVEEVLRVARASDLETLPAPAGE